MGSLVTGDVFDVLSEIESGSVNLIITDPPYESLERWRKIGTKTRLKQSEASSNTWFPVIPNDDFFPMFLEFYRVLKPGSFFYIFCDEETRDILLYGKSVKNTVAVNENLAIEKLKEHNFPIEFPNKIFSPVGITNFKLWKTLVWKKEGRLGLGYHFRAQYEFILMLEKLETKHKHRRLNTNSEPDVFSIKSLRSKHNFPSEKPSELIEKLIIPSTNEGEIVLDPFCGSGVVGSTCKKINRRFIISDIDTSVAEVRLP